MNLRSTAAIALVSVAALLGSTLSASAEDRNPRQDRHFEHEHRGDGMRFEGRMRDGGGRGGLIALTCNPNAAGRLEQRFTSLSERLNLTAEQKPQFEALEAAALAAQTSFADTCAVERPVAAVAPDTAPATPGTEAKPGAEPADTATAAPERPNMLERMQTRLKLEQARVTALTDLMPAFESFYSGLSDEQKATLEPRREGMRFREGREDRDGDRGDRRHRRHHHDG